MDVFDKYFVFEEHIFIIEKIHGILFVYFDLLLLHRRGHNWIKRRSRALTVSAWPVLLFVFICLFRSRNRCEKKTSRINTINSTVKKDARLFINGRYIHHIQSRLIKTLLFFCQQNNCIFFFVGLKIVQNSKGRATHDMRTRNRSSAVIDHAFDAGMCKNDLFSAEEARMGNLAFHDSQICVQATIVGQRYFRMQLNCTTQNILNV